MILNCNKIQYDLLRFQGRSHQEEIAADQVGEDRVGRRHIRGEGRIEAVQVGDLRGRDNAGAVGIKEQITVGEVVDEALVRRSGHRGPGLRPQLGRGEGGAAQACVDDLVEDQFVHTGGEVPQLIHPIEAWGFVEGEEIVSSTPCDDVVPLAADEGVVTSLSLHQIIAEAAADNVVAIAAVEIIGAILTEEAVVPLSAIHIVVAGAAIHLIFAGIPTQHIKAVFTVDRVIPFTAIDKVIVIAGPEGVRACIAPHAVIPTQALELIGAAGAAKELAGLALPVGTEHAAGIKVVATIADKHAIHIASPAHQPLSSGDINHRLSGPKQ